MKEICVIATNYPTDNNQIHIFLDNVVRLFVDRGIKCNIIAPQSTYSYLRRKDKRRPFEYERISPNGVPYRIYSPLFTVFPPKTICGICLADQSKYSFLRAVRRVYKARKMHADLIYSHFIQAGIPAVILAKELGVPSYIANGEADTIDSIKSNSRKLVRQTLENVTGIISVSTKCKEEIRQLCGNDENVMKKIIVIPNAADSERFYKLDQVACRKELGFPEDGFIAAFTGSFIERKGIQKVAKAVDALGDIYAEFIGVGPLEPKCRNILFKGCVKNEDMVKYLNAADVFVLPTLAEGCCNAIVEAVVCGLPVISSNRSFNCDVLDDSCALLINPENQDEITDALRTLRDNPEKREELAAGSIERAKELSLDCRVDKILAFIAGSNEDRG